MTEDDDKQPDRPLTPEEEAQPRLLTSAELKRIDECLLSNASHRWSKVARVIGQTMLALSREFPRMPDLRRLRKNYTNRFITSARVFVSSLVGVISASSIIT